MICDCSFHSDREMKEVQWFYDRVDRLSYRGFVEAIGMLFCSKHERTCAWFTRFVLGCYGKIITDAMDSARPPSRRSRAEVLNDLCLEPPKPLRLVGGKV